MNEKREALIIANDQFEDTGLRQLEAPPQDARSLERVLSNPDIGGFNVQILLNKSSDIVRKSVETFFLDRKRDDLLLLYFSGHGIKDLNGHLYFATKETQRKKLLSTAIDSQFVRDCMGKSISKRQILLLDCCYSGAFGRTKNDGNSVHLGDIFKGEGRVILTSSDAMQYAFEGDKIEGLGVHSIFTKALVDGIETGNADLDKDGHISIDELYDYVYEEVINQKPEQTPQKWQFDIKGKVIIALNFIQLQEIAWRENASKLIALSKINNDSTDSTTEKSLNEINELLVDTSIRFFEKKSLIGAKYLELAESLFESLRYTEGCEAFDLAAKLDEERFDYYTAQKGNAFAYLRNFEDAHIAYLEALEKNPKNWLAIIGESEVVSHYGNLDLALSCVESALQIAPNEFAIWNQKGRLLLDLKLLDEAIISFKMALTLSPNNPIVLENLNYVLDIQRSRKTQNNLREYTGEYLAEYRVKMFGKGGKVLALVVNKKRYEVIIEKIYELPLIRAIKSFWNGPTETLIRIISQDFKRMEGLFLRIPNDLVDAYSEYISSEHRIEIAAMGNTIYLMICSDIDRYLILNIDLDRPAFDIEDNNGDHVYNKKMSRHILHYPKANSTYVPIPKELENSLDPKGIKKTIHIGAKTKNE